MKKISIISPTYNEEVIIKNHYESVKKIIDEIKNYEFEIIYIDNSSTDSTSNIIKNIIKGDKRVRLIVNTRNFGHVRSPYWGIMQTNGDATIYLASDLQDPPNLIKDFIKFWEKGWMIVLGVKNESESKGLLNLFRIVYYKVLNFFSNVPVIENSTGFGFSITYATFASSGTSKY
jgi:dolichol-phosphate mannosyltransferase